MRSAFPALSLTDLHEHPQHACRVFSSQVLTAGLTDCDGSDRLVVPDSYTAQRVLDLSVGRAQMLTWPTSLAINRELAIGPPVM